MALALFVPQTSALHLKRILPDKLLKFAKNWTELENLIEKPEIDVAVCDPHVEGALNVAAVAKILRRHPRTILVAYVEPVAANLKGVFALSKLGLNHVFVHPTREGDTAFRNAVDGVTRNPFAADVLSTVDSTWATFPATLVAALYDLFERPHCYHLARDLADQSGMSVRALHRRFQTAGFGTPRQVMAFAKVVTGYACMRSSGLGVLETSVKLRYSQQRHFTNHAREILNCPPSRILKDLGNDEVVLRFVEWLHAPDKARNRSLRFRRSLRRGNIPRGADESGSGV
jgi:AraC-type DNA-binding domain-containing proteins